MKHFFAFVLAFIAALSIAAAETVITDSGEYVDVPDGYKVLFVPAWVKADRLVQEVSVPSIEVADETSDVDEPSISEPSAPRACTPPGQLGLGAPPCPIDDTPVPGRFDPPNCTPRGQLSLGAPPCRE